MRGGGGPGAGQGAEGEEALEGGEVHVRARLDPRLQVCRLDGWRRAAPGEGAMIQGGYGGDGMWGGCEGGAWRGGQIRGAEEVLVRGKRGWSMVGGVMIVGPGSGSGAGED